MICASQWGHLFLGVVLLLGLQTYVEPNQGISVRMQAVSSGALQWPQLPNQACVPELSYTIHIRWRGKLSQREGPKDNDKRKSHVNGSSMNAQTYFRD